MMHETMNVKLKLVNTLANVAEWIGRLVWREDEFDGDSTSS